MIADFGPDCSRAIRWTSCELSPALVSRAGRAGLANSVLDWEVGKSAAVLRALTPLPGASSSVVVFSEP